MRNIILNNIKTGLESEIGSGSSYGSDLIEDIQTRVPENVTVNKFVGITIDRVSPLERSIGKFYPTNHEYICTVAILVKNADYNDGQTQLDTIIRRILKYFSKDTGSLNGLSDTTDDVTETVITYRIDSLDYTDGKLKAGEIGHVCFVSLSIRTELII